jgi:hypothetical protein
MGSRMRAGVVLQKNTLQQPSCPFLCMWISTPFTPSGHKNEPQPLVLPLCRSTVVQPCLPFKCNWCTKNKVTLIGVCGQVVNTPASYLGGPRFKVLAWR